MLNLTNMTDDKQPILLPAVRFEPDYTPSNNLDQRAMMIGLGVVFLSLVHTAKAQQAAAQLASDSSSSLYVLCLVISVGGLCYFLVSHMASGKSGSKGSLMQSLPPPLPKSSLPFRSSADTLDEGRFGYGQVPRPIPSTIRPSFAKPPSSLQSAGLSDRADTKVAPSLGRSSQTVFASCAYRPTHLPSASSSHTHTPLIELQREALQLSTLIAQADEKIAQFKQELDETRKRLKKMTSQDQRLQSVYEKAKTDINGFCKAEVTARAELVRQQSDVNAQIQDLFDAQFTGSLDDMRGSTTDDGSTRTYGSATPDSPLALSWKSVPAMSASSSSETVFDSTKAVEQ